MPVIVNGLSMPRTIDAGDISMYEPEYALSDTEKWMQFYPTSGLFDVKTLGGSYLFYVRNTDTNDIIACCDVVYSQSTSDEINLSIYYVVSNPIYMRMGAIKFMMYTIYSYFYYISRDLFIGVGRFDFESIKINIRLHVAKDSFPFINFYDRFLLYAKLGFTPISGTVGTFLNTYYDIKNISIAADIYDDSCTPGTFTYIGSDGKPITDSLCSIKKHIPIIYPTGDNIVMQCMVHNLDIEKIKKKLEPFELIIAKPVEIVMPNVQRAIIAHTGIVHDATNPDFFMTAQLPTNVELVLCTTPGSFIYDSTLIKFKQFYRTYMEDKPIVFLKQAFANYKTVSGKGIPSESLNDGIDYIQATSGSIIFNKENSPPIVNEHIQLHCYEPGDYYPNIKLLVYTGKDADKNYASSIAAIYDLKDSVFSVYSQLPSISQLIVKKPNIDKTYANTWYLKDFIDKYGAIKDKRIRIMIFTCGVTSDSEKDKRLRELSLKKLSAQITTSEADLESKLGSVGKGLDIMFGKYRSDYKKVDEFIPFPSITEIQAAPDAAAGGAGAIAGPNGQQILIPFIPSGTTKPMNIDGGGRRRRKTFKRRRVPSKRRRTRYHSIRHGRSSRSSRK